MTMRQIWTVFLPVVVAGCATTPASLKGSFTEVTPEQIRGGPEHHGGMHVRWGGDIANVAPGKEQTCFTVLSRPLNDSGRPEEGDKTLGRFIACGEGFYDPEVYSRKRQVTVVGNLVGTTTEKIGEYNYRYPKIAASTIYLWPKEQKYTPGASPYYYPYYYPYYSPFYSPFCGPFYGPWGCAPYWW